VWALGDHAIILDIFNNYCSIKEIQVLYKKGESMGIIIVSIVFIGALVYGGIIAEQDLNDELSKERQEK